MACKLQPVKGQSGVYTAESVQDLQNFIYEAFSEAIMDSEGGSDARALKVGLKRALHKIGNAYNDLRQLSVISRYVSEAAEDEEFMGMSAFFPEAGVYNTIQDAIKGEVSEETTQAQYEESETSKNELHQIKTQFLDDFLGNKARLKNQLKQDVTHQLLNTFIINREEGKIITNIGEANRMAREYKQKLFDQVMDYFKKARPTEYNMTDTQLYDGDKYTGVIQNAKMLTRYLDDLTPDRLQAIHDSDIDKYNAATAWFTLKNFDNFVNLLLGDIIDVHPNHKNAFKDGDGYQYATKGHHVITTWRKESDEYHLNTEIGALVQSLINSTPFYNKGIDNKSGKFIKFEDFYRMITKMKDLALNPEARRIIVNRRNYPFLFGPDSDLSLDEQRLIENQSLRSLINNIRLNPQIYSRLAMRVLVQGNNMNTLGYNQEERNKTYSVYKGIFSTDKESIYQIQNQGIYDHNVPNYYSLITQVTDSLFTVDFLQYNEEDGVINVRTLKDQGSDNIRRRIEAGIQGFNSRKIIGTDFETQQMEPYDMSPIINETNDKFEGITFTLKMGGDMVTDHNYDLTVALSDLGQVLTVYDADNQVVEDLGVYLRSSEFKNFIDDQLNLGLSQDMDLLEAIETVYKDYGESTAVKDLLTLAANVYMNKYISNVLLSDTTGRKNTLAKLKEIFSDSDITPGYNSTLGEMSLVPQKLIPVLNRIAEAKSITTGEAQSAQVRDADGNMLSSQTLSRLLGSLQSQWERIRKSPDNAASGFSLLQSDIFKGCYTSKEYKSMMGNKPHTQFTVAESVQGNFLYDFVGGFISVDNTSGKKIIGNGVIGLLPSVNSDKNTIGRMLIDLAEECKTNIPGLATLGRNKTWAELTVDELQQVIAKELGDYYNKSYNNVVKDFQHLQNWLATYKNIKVDINPETDFRELNEYCENISKEKADQLLQKWVAQQQELNVPVTSENISKQYDKYYKEVSKSTSATLYEWTREYNNIYPNSPIRLIEQTHYINNGSGIKFNNTFKALRRRYADPKKLAEFFDLKRTELLKSLVDENVEIDLFSETTEKTTPKGWLRNKYPDWVHKSAAVKNGKMVLAKLTYGGKTYNITSKADLSEFNKVVKNNTNEINPDFIRNPHKLLNPKYGIKVEMHPMLDKYNTMDYLFTQEFMLAGVGSHINHPGKAKYKTDIIWAHPGIGKTYALENTQYKDQVMDWDVEFNHRRDAWIAKQSGTIKGTDAFKKARNEYLINWKFHKDFQKFVKGEWERVKQLANSQNKILVASPHMLLELFQEDFGQILTMSKDDFVKRGKARGDANPELWKEGIDNTINSLATNPVFQKKLVTINEGAYLADMLDNGSLYNALGQLRENEMQEEAARFLAQHKRNVSYTAAMHEFQLESINGIPTEYNMAIIDDIKAPVYTISGDRGNHAPFDGATFVNPLVVIWENNSLEESKAGIDKKQFIHYYDEATGTGGIVKTAGFGLTNDRIRRYQFYRDMVHNMMNRQWKNTDGTNHIMREGGILVDYNGKNVNYGPVYFMKNGKYYMREIDAYMGNNTYKVTTTEVDESGNVLGWDIEETIQVNSNYDIWNMFGGHNAMELKKNQLVWSEKSIELTARAANNYGTIKEGVNKVITAQDLVQPMKMSDVHYMPTVGAIKQGACNINPKSCFYGKHNLNFMKVRMLQAGIQLDKEHHADNSELSLMTQVLSAACANGYNPGAAQRLYNAIYSLTKAGTQEFRNELGNVVMGDQEKFDQAVTGIIMKAMINSTSSDGDLVQAIAQDLLKEMRTSKDFSFSPEFYEKAKSIIPNSDPTIYPKIVNMLTVALTKSGIKTKMPGILAVLCPSHEIIKFYKVPAFDRNGVPTGQYKRVTIDKLEQMYKTSDIDAILDLLQDEELFLQHPSEVEIGYKYLVTKSDGTQEVIHINRIHGKTQGEGFRNYKGKTLRYSEVSYEEFKKMDKAVIQEWVKEGQDLRSYNVRFTGSDGQLYQLADLDIVNEYFYLKDLEDIEEQMLLASKYLNKYKKQREFIDRIKHDLTRGQDASKQIAPFLTLLETGDIAKVIEYCNTAGALGKQFKNYLNRRLIHFMNRQMQLALDGISPTSESVNVTINGKPIAVNKETIQISSYGLVMPKTFKSNLGLGEFDELEDIKNDPLFFVDKLIDRFGTKVESYEDEEGNLINNFHLELKRSDGNHIYVRKGLTGSDLVKKVDIITRTDEDGNVFRINGDGKVMYQLHSAEDVVYQDYEGNEIIVTSDDKVTWTDMDDNEIDITGMEITRSVGDVWINSKTGDQIKRKFDSGMQFYLDTMDYNSFSISSASTDNEFSDILSKAQNSSNQTASKLANRIAKVGEGKDDFKKTIAQRNLVNKMNNYRAMLEDAELKDFAMQHLRELGEQMHTSFLRSLEIIAARIPAQSQQSFMAMQVESYDNPDINSAYVSLFQFYLQGSDLDIDAVSLQTFELGRNGLYVGHSPHYSLANEDMRKASDKIPFPTGTKVKENITKARNTTLASLMNERLLGRTNKEGMNSLFNIEVRNDKSIKVTLNVSTPEAILRFAQFLEDINNNGFNSTTDNDYLAVAQAMNAQFGGKDVNFGINMVKEIAEQIKNIVNTHNLYLTKLKPKKREQVIKNYATAQLREIIEDPINRRQADSSVDVVTGPAKDLAKLSPKATVQTTFTPGNVANKFQSISENMVGKDGIAICATGLKSFFAITDTYQEILNGDNIEEKDSLLFNVDFGGKTYKGLANGYSVDYKSPYETSITEEDRAFIDSRFSPDVQNYLLDQLWASDAANEMSALLGLSTDNAKELVLAKINAGTASMGMYLYGLSIGIPFDQLYDVMTTPLAFRLTELTKGDSFNGNSGTINIIGALRYLKQEPLDQMTRFNRIDLSDYKDVPKPSELLQTLLRDSWKPNFPNEEALDGYIKSKGGVLRTLIDRNPQHLEAAKDTLESLRGQTSKYKKLIKDPRVFERYEVLFNQLIDFTQQYIDDVSLIEGAGDRDNIHGASTLYSDLERLATGAEEMKQIGKILRLNQEIKTNASDLIGQVANIEEAIIRRAKQLKAQLGREFGIFNREDYRGDPEIGDIIFNKNLTKSFSQGGYRIDLEQFITNPEYANKVIKIYDIIKQSYNPLKVIKTAPQYKGYSESLLLAYKGLRNQSVKFRLAVDEARNFFEEYDVVNPKLRQQVVKNIERATDLYMRQAWMLKTVKPITLPASTDKMTTFAFIDNGVKSKVLNYNTEIRLGTELGDANYKLWMETQVIPKLKEMYPNNKFIRNLQPVVNVGTNLGAVSVNYGLPINMMPKSDYDRDAFNEYKEAFNELIKLPAYHDGAGKSMTLQNMFYYYSMIANGGRVGPTSLHGIFEDYMTQERNNHPPKSFREFVSNADASEKTYKAILGFLNDEMIAPFSSPYAGGTRILRYKNKDNDRIDLYIKPKRDTSDDNPAYDDDYNPMEEYFDYEAIMGNYHDKTAEINGFKKETDTYGVMHNSDNRNYFLNPVAVSGYSPTQVVTVSREEMDKYPTLSRFQVTIAPAKKGRELKAGLVDIMSSKVEDRPLIYKFINKIRKENNGMIATAITMNEVGMTDVVAVKKWLESALSAIENNCI